ncbi:LPXTG cell wall anchor domain-containing protein [Lactococcus garvieae]|uniref:LPXTG cell wall anchor domain-containing protein n=1 Tax=Lactococcus garvieae TaxID=1363 RepID=UPI0018D6E147|nr:LPXTG cell wall anchor domain-containing protein [Lactococcus garvieae]QPS71733.1 LPXTG cell wall anchor domain-containing protein [Lactococcus garvieae]
MKKRLKLALTFFFSITMLGFGIHAVGADEGHTQKLIVVKYGLSQNSNGFSQKQTDNSGLKINNIIVDDLGNQLKTVPNITYTVQKIIPPGVNPILISDYSTYTEVGAPLKIVTDQKGVASVILEDGNYILEEQPNKNQGLTQPADPLLLAFPTVDELDEVYIYPKSSVIKTTTVPPKKELTYRPPQHVQNLPSTGEIVSWILMILGAVLLMILAVTLNHREKVDETTIRK